MAFMRIQTNFKNLVNFFSHSDHQKCYSFLALFMYKFEAIAFPTSSGIAKSFSSFPGYTGIAKDKEYLPKLVVRHDL